MVKTMWASPFPRFPMQQAVQGMPHDQVDWAALAKQWIAQRESAGPHQDPNVAPPPPPHGPPPPPPSMHGNHQGPPDFQGGPPNFHGGPPQGGPPNQMHGGNQDDMDLSDGENGNSRDYNHGQPQEWGWDMQQQQQIWNAAQPGWGMQPPMEGQTFDYDHGGFPQHAQGFDYNHSGGTDFNYDQQGMENQGEYNQFWEDNQTGPHRHHNQRDFRNRNRNRDRDRFRSPPKPEEDTVLDAAKRKTLPAWIREGLEKMEMEKQKKMEKERQDMERLEAKKLREEAEKEVKDEMLAGSGKDGGPVLPKKSRFDSDDEGSEKSRSRSRSPNREKSPKPRLKSKSKSPSPERVIKKRSPSPEDYKTEEEKQMEMELVMALTVVKKKVMIERMGKMMTMTLM
ncbi:hypothetical protein KUTeg_007180 [Tegillarca granosa]|uniref:Uncharacterized protein n=1 Tax=Tegillarca granosa TaxID=220873 RepID=A0ABQ9FH69_TEGGR|nr:hypothetical protein KUTeg_007180 [Tegillarca granosa]